MNPNLISSACFRGRQLLVSLLCTGILVLIDSLDANAQNPGDVRVDSLCQQCPLPLHRLELDISQNLNQPEQISLHWVAENEMNTRSFVVERGTDGRQFEAVHEKPARGFTNTATHYYETDDISALLPGALVYYRIAAVDLNGRRGYSNIVSVKCGQPLTQLAWPNPFKQHFFVRVQLKEAAPVTMRLFDASGCMALSITQKAARGESVLPVTVAASLQPGMYLLELVSDKGRLLTQKIVKQ